MTTSRPTSRPRSVPTRPAMPELTQDETEPIRSAARRTSCRREYLDGSRGDRLHLGVHRQQNVRERRQFGNRLYRLGRRHCMLDLVGPEPSEFSSTTLQYADSFLLVKSGEASVFTTTKGKALLTTTTGALPRPNWYTEKPPWCTSVAGFFPPRLSRTALRLSRVPRRSTSIARGIDIFVDGDTRLDDDVAGRAWVSYVTERVAGIGAPRVEVPPAGFMADKGPGDLMWEVIETRMTPPVDRQDQ